MTSFEQNIWIDDSIGIWLSQGIKLNPPSSLKRIMEVEFTLGFRFPRPFKKLYLKMNGFKDFDWDSEMFSLWSLDRILVEYRHVGEGDWVPVCDYLICSHDFGFLPGRNSVFKRQLGEYTEIADDFESFIQLLLSNDGLLY